MLWSMHGLNSALHFTETESGQNEILMLTEFCFEIQTCPPMQASDIPTHASPHQVHMHLHGDLQDECTAMTMGQAA